MVLIFNYKQESILLLVLRLQLLDTDRNYYLLKALYGLLMLLPQSSAFTMLRNRLDCVPHVHQLPQALKDQYEFEFILSSFYFILFPHFSLHK